MWRYVRITERQLAQMVQTSTPTKVLKKKTVRTVVENGEGNATGRNYDSEVKSPYEPPGKGTLSEVQIPIQQQYITPKPFYATQQQQTEYTDSSFAPQGPTIGSKAATKKVKKSVLQQQYRVFP